LVLSPLILLQFGWRALFYTFGLVGLPLLAIWLATAPKPLAKPPAPSPPPAAAGGTVEGAQQAAAAAATDTSSNSSKAVYEGDKGNVSVWRLLSHPATWAIIIVNTVNHWGYFIYLNWMPSYFVKVGGGGGGLGWVGLEVV
jgi:ACS family sodium-dependent inorganic phosphate cotransporter/ACS family sodium-dependent inorganic phosphate cotransporter-like MFS transporter 9